MGNQDTCRFWSPLVAGLTPYTPGEQPKMPDLAKLNTNENPFPPSPRVIEAIKQEAGDALRLYPDPDASRLREAVAAIHGVEPTSVFPGNGSDEVLSHVFMALLKHDKPVLFPDVTYSFYPVWCGLHGIDFETVPLTDDFTIRVKDYARPNGGIVIANPNAPTGILLPVDDIARLAKGSPDSVVVVDEAYVDFGGETAIGLTRKLPNLLVVQTLSKSRSLAGLRVGFAVGHPRLIEALERIKNSFNSYPLGRLAIAGAVAALEDKEYFEQTRKAVIDAREMMVQGLVDVGFFVLPSSANFILARHYKLDSAKLAASLRALGIIVRHFKLPRVEDFLRISVGTTDDCMRLLAALGEMAYA